MTQFASRIALILATLATVVTMAAAPAQSAVISKSAGIAVSAYVLPQGAPVEAPHATTHAMVAENGAPAVDTTTFTY